MGLAAPKNRRKLGNDPNNTKWSRNTENFGHRMLRSQGWEPGQYLGPQDAAHAVYHTAASASHIRVALKEDNLGLGAKISRGDECTGLNAFKEMLARLNGKSEAAIEQDKKAKEMHARNVYVERKFGTMRFVSGGFLVGDVIQEKKEISEAESSDGTPKPAGASAKQEEKKKKKKRKAVDEEEDRDEAELSKEERRRAKKLRKSGKEANLGGDEDQVKSEEKLSRSSSKKDKKRSKDKKPASEDGDSEDGGSEAQEESPEDRRKREKKERKERRRQKREKKLKKKQRAEEESSDDNSDQGSPAPNTGTSTPAGSGTSTPVSQVSIRHLARRRFIAQKRMALKDQQALNQIFMIKSA